MFDSFRDMEDNAPDGGYGVWGGGEDAPESTSEPHKPGQDPLIQGKDAPAAVRQEQTKSGQFGTSSANAVKSSMSAARSARGAGEDAATAAKTPISSASNAPAAGAGSTAGSAASSGTVTAAPGSTASSGPSATSAVRRQRLTITITAIELRPDPIISFDVTTNLPRFRSTSYKGVRRTYSELRKFANHLSSATPECFVPVLPPATTSFPEKSPENMHTIKDGIQKWFNRITRSPLLARDEEFLYFIEYKSNYTPVVKIKPPATGLTRKVIKQRAPPQDSVAELHDFRPVAKLVYQYATEAHGRAVRVAKSRRQVAQALEELSQRSSAMVQCETQKGMINLWSKLAKVVSTVGDIENSKATLFEGYFADPVQITARDAYAIKETLTNRHILMRDLIRCQADSAARHETATRLRGANNISVAKVDEAITQLEDAKQLERKVTSAVRRVTDNLVVEKPIALNRVESDLLGAIAHLTFRTIECDRRILASWESIRRDVRAVDSRGGLSRLGREGTTPRRSQPFSQSLAGDSWSGDRIYRAKDLAPTDDAQEVVDARSAASLLSSVYD